MEEEEDKVLGALRVGRMNTLSVSTFSALFILHCPLLLFTENIV